MDEGDEGDELLRGQAGWTTVSGRKGVASRRRRSSTGVVSLATPIAKRVTHGNRFQSLMPSASESVEDDGEQQQVQVVPPLMSCE